MQFFPLLTKQEGTLGPRPSPQLSRHMAASKLGRAQQSPSRTHLQPKILAFVQIHFWFFEVRRDFHPNISFIHIHIYIHINIYVNIYIYIGFFLCLTLTMNNSICHSSSWMGKAETETAFSIQHRGALVSSPSLPGPGNVEALICHSTTVASVPVSLLRQILL